MSDSKQPELMPEILTYYDYDFSKYPDRIRISFKDGKTMVYEARYTQPHPAVIESIRLVRNMKQGYVNQPERRRRRK